MYNHKHKEGANKLHMSPLAKTHSCPPSVQRNDAMMRQYSCTRATTRTSIICTKKSCHGKQQIACKRKPSSSHTTSGGVSFMWAGCSKHCCGLHEKKKRLLAVRYHSHNKRPGTTAFDILPRLPTGRRINIMTSLCTLLLYIRVERY